MLPPEATDKLPPSCGDVSPDISENSVLTIIWLLLLVVSTATPVPPVICLNCSPSVVLLTETTAASCPTKLDGVSSSPKKVNFSPKPN